MKTENTVLHPSQFISQQYTDIIRNTAAEAEKTGTLHPQQLALIYINKWFRLLVPEVYAGLQITLPELLQQQEAISWADGSMGWVVTLCNGAGWFGGFISPEIAPDIFGNEDVCLAGSGAATGAAEVTATGYCINGAWDTPRYPYYRKLHYNKQWGACINRRRTADTPFYIRPEGCYHCAGMEIHRHGGYRQRRF
ncbi:MAG: hypothetical protein V4577_05050 [Bacteroidota bacterium]